MDYLNEEMYYTNALLKEESKACKTKKQTLSHHGGHKLAEATLPSIEENRLIIKTQKFRGKACGAWLQTSEEGALLNWSRYL